MGEQWKDYIKHMGDSAIAEITTLRRELEEARAEVANFKRCWIGTQVDEVAAHKIEQLETRAEKAERKRDELRVVVAALEKYTGTARFGEFIIRHRGWCSFSDNVRCRCGASELRRALDALPGEG